MAGVKIRPGSVSPDWRLVRASKPLWITLLWLLPAVAQAQFTFTTNNSAITITGYTGPGGNVVIPATTNGYPVTSIGDNAFSGSFLQPNYTLTSITIPDSIVSIGADAFYVCKDLTNAMIGQGVTSIGNYAFNQCTSLANLTVPANVISIGAYAFFSCSSLTGNLDLPDSIITLGTGAFEGCNGLTSVTIGRNIAGIGDYTFSTGNGLTDIYFKGDAPNASLNVFGANNSLTVYYLPGTANWGSLFSGRPTAPWFLPNPRILNFEPNFGIQANGFSFTISWATNAPVVVEGCTNMANPVWTPVSTNSLTGGTAYFNDPQWTNYPSRFYRVRSP